MPGLESKKDLGSSAEFNNCAAWILTNKTDARKNPNALRGDPFIQEAIELISCRYEDGTNWGKEVSIINHGTFKYIIPIKNQ